MKARLRLALTRWEILYVCAAASDVTYVLTWPHIDALGWFLLVTGPLVILGAMFFPPRVICDDNGRPVTGNAAVCETTDD